MTSPRSRAACSTKLRPHRCAAGLLRMGATLSVAIILVLAAAGGTAFADATRASRSPIPHDTLSTRATTATTATLEAFGAPGAPPPGAPPPGAPPPGAPPPGAPSPPAPSPAASPTCPPNLIATPVTRPPSPASQPGSPLGSPTTLPDGTVVTPSCVLPPPAPLPGPDISPQHTVGGEKLAAPGVTVDAPGDVPAPPGVTDVSYLVADMDTGAVLVAKSPHTLLLPASTLKALLALTTLPRLDPTDRVVPSEADVDAIGSRVGLLAGNAYTIEQLYLGLVLVSGNDAAYALADAFGGRARTVAAMDTVAGHLGAWDTRVVDPSGLDEPGQRSSAYDLALIGRAVMQLPDYRRYAQTRSAGFPGGVDPTGAVRPGFEIQNHNLLLEHYSGAFGVKNGYTTGARHTFIGAAERNGRRLIVTQLGGVVVPSWEPTALLLDWTFRYADQLTPVGRLVDPGSAPQPPEWAAFDAAPAVPATGAPVPPLSTPTDAADSAGTDGAGTDGAGTDGAGTDGAGSDLTGTDSSAGGSAAADSAGGDAPPEQAGDSPVPAVAPYVAAGAVVVLLVGVAVTWRRRRSAGRFE